MRNRRGIWLLPPIAIGGGIAVWLISTAEPPGRVAEQERSVVARTTKAELAPIRTVIRGYGDVEAARSWEATSEVAGSIVWRHPELEAGNVLLQGTQVLQIDPTTYELAFAQAEADLAALDADIAQIDVDQVNTHRLLALEENRLELAETALERIRNLVERGAASQSALDEQERATLQVRRSVTELHNALQLIPGRRNRLDALVAHTVAILARAKRDLEKTGIVVPFDVRVASVRVEQHQFVAEGQPLLTADDIGQAEITPRSYRPGRRRYPDRKCRRDRGRPGRRFPARSDLVAASPGLGFEIGGQSANSAETVVSILRGFLIGLVGIYVVLSFQFRSYVEPVVVMLSIPLAFIGVVLGHLVMGYNISMPSLIGAASLAGIVVNNAILLVQVIKRHASEGMDLARAAGDASRERFRPILMSVSTTMMGLIPLLLETRTQAQTLKPLVISVAFGLFSATVLVLIVLPAFYAILGDFGLAQGASGSHQTRSRERGSIAE